jgi:RNA polymerase sigma factor (sigma-70 family)
MAMRTQRNGMSGGGREDAETRFRGLYHEHGRAVLAYAVRRCSDSADAADVVADTFLVAWRRLPDVPSGGEARMWLYGVARRMLANQQRGERRRERLAERLRLELPAELATVTEVADGGPVPAALGVLAEDDRDILLLSAWEQLQPAEIAAVLGISRVAARSRLHRARARLRAALGDDPEQASSLVRPGCEVAP